MQACRYMPCLAAMFWFYCLVYLEHCLELLSWGLSYVCTYFSHLFNPMPMGMAVSIFRYFGFAPGTFLAIITHSYIYSINYLCVCACVHGWVSEWDILFIAFVLYSLQSTVSCVFLWYHSYYIHKLTVSARVMDKALWSTKPRYLLLVVSVPSSSYLAAIILIVYSFSNYYFHGYFTTSVFIVCFILLLPSSFIQSKCVWLKSLSVVFNYSFIVTNFHFLYKLLFNSSIF